MRYKKNFNTKKQSKLPFIGIALLFALLLGMVMKAGVDERCLSIREQVKQGYIQKTEIVEELCY